MSGFRVAKKRCSECLFSDARVVSESRAKSIIEKCLKNDSHFICHKSTIAKREAMCRGHYDEVEQGRLPPPQMLRIAERLDVVDFVEVE